VKIAKTNPRIQIRRALATDAAAIARVLHQSFLEYQAFYTAAALAFTAPSADQIQQRMKEGPVWVALQLDGVVGTVSVVANDDGLYVCPRLAAWV
jgi:L-amino acid N-acyltransferase YncA